MADVTKIPGSSPTQPSRSPREPAKPGTEKFKELMKVDKSDEEQKKQKKRQEQAAEDTKAKLRTEMAASPKTPPPTKPLAPFPKKVEAPKKKIEEAPLPKQLPPPPPAPQPLEATIEETPPSPPEIPAEIQKPALPPPLPPKQEKLPEETIAPLTSPLGPLLIPPAPESAPAYTLLKPEVLSLFERMVSQIVIMQTSGVNETTLHLNTPDFYNSIFAGARIVIKEWSTAPLAYNIEFFGSQQNTAYFAQNVPALFAAFASEKRSYSIKNIETSLEREEDRPVFRRKERPSDQNQEPS